jgi:hypothetical protein
MERYHHPTRYLRWSEEIYTARIGKKRNADKILVGNSAEKCSLGILRTI